MRKIGILTTDCYRGTLVITLYRHRDFLVALGLDATIVATILRGKVKVAQKDKTVAHYFAFHYYGTDQELSHQLTTITGLKVQFK